MLVFACFGMTCGYFVFSSQLIVQLLEAVGAPPFWRNRVVVLFVSAAAVFPLSLMRRLSDFRYLTLITVIGPTSTENV
jgi:Transmembrane amino acid transporter protein.